MPPAPQGVGGGPQVPPRGGDGQERVLSVSGKKKCSACKEELGLYRVTHKGLYGIYIACFIIKRLYFRKKT